MDKKKQFQIDNLKSKLKTYYTNLQKLKDTYNKLSDEQKSINPNLESINNLKKDKTLLEEEITKTKKNISELSNKVSNNKQELNQIPSAKAKKEEDELNIKNDELERIANQRIYETEEHKQTLETAEINRLKIAEEIEFVKQQLESQNQVITDLQISAHASRKGVLAELHQKKQNKKMINAEKENLSQQVEMVKQQNEQLQITLEKISEFKRMLVDMNYHSNLDIEKMDSYYIEFNIPKKILINEKLKLLDGIANNMKRKNEIMNRRFEKNKTAQETRIAEIIDNYNKVHRVKVIGYKDQYKAEKAKRDTLLEILADFESKYDNYDRDVIGSIMDTFSRNINTLDEDILRAEHRLEVIMFRINEEYEKYKEYLEEQEISLNENIKTFSRDINRINDKIKEIVKQIENENAFALEADKLKEEIDKYETMIRQTENDVNVLEA